jgi:Uma2 family endonuclease
VDSSAFREDVWEELLDGSIVAMSPRPAVNHGVVADNILHIFKKYLKGKKHTALGEQDVYLTEKDWVIPDVMIVCNRDTIKADGIHGAPDLIVEVLSPSTSRNDKGYKKDLYERCGVKEYWVVSAVTDAPSIEVYLLRNGKYRLDEVYSVFPDYLLGKMTEGEKGQIKREFSVSFDSGMVIKLEDVFDDMF